MKKIWIAEVINQFGKRNLRGYTSYTLAARSFKNWNKYMKNHYEDGTLIGKVYWIRIIE